MLKPDAVMARVEILHLHEKKPSVEVSLWLNQEPDIIAHVKTKMWFSGENLDLSTIRKAAIQRALWVCGQILEVRKEKEPTGVSDDFWCTGGTSRSDLERV